MQLDDYKGRFFGLLSSSFQRMTWEAHQSLWRRSVRGVMTAFLICSQAAGEERHPQNTAEPSDTLSAD